MQFARRLRAAAARSADARSWRDAAEAIVKDISRLEKKGTRILEQRQRQRLDASCSASIERIRNRRSSDHDQLQL